MTRLRGSNLRIGDKIKIKRNNVNEGYQQYKNKVWTINYIDYNGESFGFDSAVGEVLVSCDDLPFSLYPYEFTVVEKVR